MLTGQEFKPVLFALNCLFFFFSIPLNEYRLLACDIQQLFVAVTIHACSSSGSQYFRVIEDLIVLLGYLQNSKNKRTQSKIKLLWTGRSSYIIAKNVIRTSSLSLTSVEKVG